MSPADEDFLARVRAAARRIAPHVAVTPLVAMGEGGPRLKAESLHPTGAFKIRGAFNAILSLPPGTRARGVIAHSSGNHALAVAFAARRLGLAAVVVMPSNAPTVKLVGVRRLGAEVVIVGPASAERAARAANLAAERGLTLVPPYDSLEIMAATGTIALELLRQAPDAEAVFAPLSGGGLMGGVAAAIKLTRPKVRVIGVEPLLAADALESFRAGRIVSLPAEAMARTMADGLRVQRLGDLTWPRVRDFVDEIVTVSEDAIGGAMRQIAGEARLVAEPSGAVSVAGALAWPGCGPRCVAILSGGNVDPALYARILAGR
ncbi:MAG: threonine/serine dehydratase [Caulobacteraceae bacterium]